MPPTDPGVTARVLEALRAVVDPEIGRDLVSLGFVKNLKFEGGDLSFDVERDRPTANALREQIRNACLEAVSAQGIEGVLGVFVNVTVKVDRDSTRRRLLPGVRRIVAVASGKGGVGKSTTAVHLALALRDTGATVGLLDADVYGPSIPLMLGTLGVEPRVTPERKIVPIEALGIATMSMGFLSRGDEAVIWRGPMVSNMIQQFLGAVEWGELDYLVIDLPPGTGDTQLTLTQTAPLTGAVIVTTPQEVALIDARKGLRMFEKVNVPILGIVENMSYYVEESGRKVYLFGREGGRRVADQNVVPLLGEIPVDAGVVEGGDRGRPAMLANPEGPVAQAVRRFAQNVIARLDEIDGAGASAFDPSFSMEWK